MSSSPAIIRSKVDFPQPAADTTARSDSDRPSVFVICSQEAGEPPRPIIATLSYGEATSYMETDELVESVAMPAEIYRWAERFVLEHYVPEKRRKRKRDNWKAAGRGQR